ncbi:MAG TPA: hypothetical protein PK095_04730, partial [Myxococcota bacterium]|nr:hypothetical protein [Myxococcota bacterium]
QPSEGLRVAWDTQTGARLWTAKVRDGEHAAFGRLGSVVLQNDFKVWSVLGFSPRKNHMQWVDAVPAKDLTPGAEEPLFVQVGGPRGVVVGPRRVHVFSMKDGKRERSIAIPQGYTVTAAHLSDTLLAYVTSREGSRRLHLIPLPGR